MVANSPQTKGLSLLPYCCYSYSWLVSPIRCASICRSLKVQATATEVPSAVKGEQTSPPYSPVLYVRSL